MKFRKLNPAVLSVGALALLSLPLGASATEYQGDDKVLTLSREGKDLRPSVSLQGNITTPVYELNTILVPVTVQVPDTVCRTQPGEGKGDWKGFYNVPSAQKPAALAAAIQGVGLKTATRLVQDGYFSHKPRTWAEFQSEITRADQQYRTGFSHEVLAIHGQENMQNLGYYSAESCQIVMRSQVTLQAQTDRRFVRNVSRNFRIEIAGGALLRMESENFNVNFDGMNDSLTLPSSFNAYNIASRQDRGDTVIYQVSGSRRMVAPVNSLSAMPSNQGGKLGLTITDLAFDPEMGGTQGEAIAVIKVYVNRPLWADKLVATREVPLSTSSAETIINTDAEIPAGKQGYATLELKRVGSNYHSPTAMNHYVQTSKLKF